jgi:hypothetical protein
MLKLTGLLLVVAGTLAGAVLVLAPFGGLGFAPNVGTWLLFPLGILGGFVLMALGSRTESLAVISRAAGGILLALAASAAIALVLPALGAATLSGSVLSLWFVLILAMIFGTLFLVTTGKHALRV